MKDDEYIQSLYRKFVANQCNAEEMERVFKSLEDSDNEILFQQLIDASFETEMAGNAAIDAETSGRMKEKITVGMSAGTAAVVRRLAWRPLARIAAMLVLGLLLGATAYFMHTPQAKPPVVYAESTVPQGKKMTLLLSDGTRVWLNAESRFSYPQSFVGGTRRVFLEGEAYFEVSPDKARPFVIGSGKLTTTVLGTSFNVKAYPNDSAAEVAVLTGRVSVATDRAQYVLLPAQKAVYEVARNELRRETARNPADYTIWRDGKIHLQSMRMDDVARMLTRKYGVNVRFANPATRQCRVTAKFDNVPLKKILFAVCSAIDATYKDNGEEVLITGKGCAGHPAPKASGKNVGEG